MKKFTNILILQLVALSLISCGSDEEISKTAAAPQPRQVLQDQEVAPRRQKEMEANLTLKYQDEVNKKVQAMVYAKNCGNYGVIDLDQANRLFEKMRSELKNMVNEGKASKDYIDEQASELHNFIATYARMTSAQLVPYCNMITMGFMDGEK